ncbi:MAG: hypothetical protein HQK70_09145 [Desulfamplus sp.]|nr:hypothetical protein [Desulfamplus sp.]
MQEPNRTLLIILMYSAIFSDLTKKNIYVRAFKSKKTTPIGRKNRKAAWNYSSSLSVFV